MSYDEDLMALEDVERRFGKRPSKDEEIKSIQSQLKTKDELLRESVRINRQFQIYESHPDIEYRLDDFLNRPEIKAILEGGGE